MDKNEEVLDAEVQEGETSVDSETNDASTDEKYLNQKKRAEKAEAEAKEAKEAREALEQKVEALTKDDKEPEAPKKENKELTREEAILYAKGLSNEEIEKAKKVAAAEEVDLLEAVETDIFTIWKERREADAQNQSAQLGASSGSAPHKEETFRTGMSKEDHKKLWNQARGQIDLSLIG